LASSAGAVRLRVAAPPEKHESFIITTWLAFWPSMVRPCCKALSMNRPSRTNIASLQRAAVPARAPICVPWPE